MVLGNPVPDGLGDVLARAQMKTADTLLYSDIDELNEYSAVQRFREKIGKESTWDRYKYCLRDWLRFNNTLPRWNGVSPDARAHVSLNLDKIR